MPATTTSVSAAICTSADTSSPITTVGAATTATASRGAIGPVRSTVRKTTRPTTYVATPAARNQAVAAVAGSSYLTTASLIPAASTMIPPRTGRNAYPNAKSASHGVRASRAATQARSARSSSPSKYNHHNAAASASPSTAVMASPVDRL